VTWAWLKIEEEKKKRIKNYKRVQIALSGLITCCLVKMIDGLIKREKQERSYKCRLLYATVAPTTSTAQGGGLMSWLRPGDSKMPAFMPSPQSGRIYAV
jgi:hypothetical protein